MSAGCMPGSTFFRCLIGSSKGLCAVSVGVGMLSGSEEYRFAKVSHNRSQMGGTFVRESDNCRIP